MPGTSNVRSDAAGTSLMSMPAFALGRRFIAKLLRLVPRRLPAPSPSPESIRERR